MKVLMQNRIDALSKKGGDSYQMLYIKKHLESKGIEVDISLELNPELNEYDLVHLHNTTRIHETYAQFINAKRYNKKIIVSPIYHSLRDIRNYESKALSGLIGCVSKLNLSTNTVQLLKSLNYVKYYPSAWLSWLNQLRKGYLNQQKQVISDCDFLIPNSQMEMNTITNELGLTKIPPYRVIYNGIEIENQDEDKDILQWLKKLNITNYVICSGRIEPRKNNVALIKALQNDNIPVVFAGRINYLHRKYSNEFLKLVSQNSNFHYLHEVSQNGIMTLYKNAKVCVAASWFETTGLTGLEAGTTDCNVVITERGYTKEIYKDHAWYCNPEVIISIRNAVLAAYTAPRGEKKLSTHINALKLTWKNAAQLTLNAYQEVLKN